MCIGMADGYKPTGHQKKKKYSVEGFFDITVMVFIWKTGKTKSADTYYGHSSYAFYCGARYNIDLIITHIVGVNNAIADAPSHFQATCFQ